MDTNTAILSCYKGTKQDDGCVAEGAFRAVQKYFQQSDILTCEDKTVVTGSHSMEDVQGLVTATLEKYEAAKASSKTRGWLQSTSEIICHYGTILDVFVQHHPEYVSLAWGAMKLIFGSVVNHAETLKIVAKSTWQVGVRLSRVKIVSTIYPTANMRVAVENLYSCILEFLLIAHSWCKESKLRHFVHSFTRPHKLQYDDLLQRISVASDNITELAAVGSQAELRVMHTAHSGKLEGILSALEDAEKSYQQQLDGLTQLFSGLRVLNERNEKKLELVVSLLEASGMTMNDLVTKVETFQSIQTSAQLDTNQRISNLHLSNVLTTLSPAFEDPEKCYKYHLMCRNRRVSGRGVVTSTNQFWLSPRLTKWSSSHRSSLVIIKGSFNVRSAMVDFGIDIIQTLESAEVPTLWALPSLDRSKHASMSTAVDLIKYLTYQALRLSASLKTEKELSSRYSQFHTTLKPKDWLKLLGQAVRSLGTNTYIIVDLATVLSSLDQADDFHLIDELCIMLDDASMEGLKVKIVLLLYEAEWLRMAAKSDSAESVLVKSMKAKSAQAKGRKQTVAKRLVGRSKLGMK
ncbi:nacht domain protein [Colletotrichum scovillei]|uniref:Nacht domain protein n=2 Tax=Colletotrichum scovillei TaxID=1209932 RepID=A0A9P7U6R4_9PEZI|nr:nacht domain protein [Colletotrichum scovillei]KAG7049076.1 nacht domain protein [Colletotrichum scovillei]KAG7063818.1 nacht domain protein [Colletotrichum scovillei]